MENGTAYNLGNAQAAASLTAELGRNPMSGSSAFFLLAAFVVGVPATSFAQLTPPAGSAGAGNSPISGVPFGPANPSVLSDPSGIGNAAKIPPLVPNAPAPPVSYGAVDGTSLRGQVVVPPPPPYAGASQRITGRKMKPRQPPVRRRGRAEVGAFTGICRGC